MRILNSKTVPVRKSALRLFIEKLKSVIAVILLFMRDWSGVD